MEWVVWLAAFVILIGIEAATLNLCTIWFAIGALVSFFSDLYRNGEIRAGGCVLYRFLCAPYFYQAFGREIYQ